MDSTKTPRNETRLHGDPSAEIIAWHLDARRRTESLIAGLDESQLLGPRLAIVNPILWEIGHVAWFQEFWVLRRARGESPMRSDGDSLYDSARVAHDTRWDLPLPSLRETLAYAEAVLDRALGHLRSKDPTDEEAYFHRLAIFHEDMHGEAFAYTRQTLGYASPWPASLEEADTPQEDLCAEDVEITGGELMLGASRQAPFVFDNEKWAHRVEVRPFRMARAATTNQQFLAFVEDGGYSNPSFWSEAGWAWRAASTLRAPVYWRKTPSGEWQRRLFDRWVPLEPRFPALHLNWFEAQAYCRWAGRRLPTEAEWELAATGNQSSRIYPWGSAAPTVERANLDGRRGGVIDVASLPAGDGPFGSRQLFGNVWEWTSSDFAPYPGFVIDPYREYSAPWFGTHKVLRGGSWATPGRLLRNTWRNFYTPDRSDIFAGFRTCAANR